MQEQEDEISPELKDIIEMLRRYVEANRKEVCFVASFIAFKKNPDSKCPECGGDSCDISDEASRVLAYGDLNNLRALLNELRDAVEDEIDEDEFVNI